MSSGRATLGAGLASVFVVAVYVDLCQWPARGQLWCHLMTDGGPEELIEFGLKLGLKPEWLQGAGTPREHFDIPPEKRDLALQLGAVPVSPQEIVRRCVIPKRGNE